MNLISPVSTPNRNNVATSPDGSSARLVDLRSLFSDSAPADGGTPKRSMDPPTNAVPRAYSVEVRAVPPPPASFPSTGGRAERPPPARMTWPSPPSPQQQQQYAQANRRQQQQPFSLQFDRGQKQQQQQRTPHNRQNNMGNKKFEVRLGRAESTVVPVKRKW